MQTNAQSGTPRVSSGAVAGPCRYLRVAVTGRCNLRCPYCHREGHPESVRAAVGLPAERLMACIEVAARVGIRKLKLLGGEPLLRPDLPELVAAARRLAPDLDISLITAGVADPALVPALVAAGLDRINVTLHGFTIEAFSRCAPSAALAHGRRAAFLDAVLASGRPTKLNYIYGGPDDAADLQSLLSFAAPRGVLVNVLDDLTRDLSWRDVADVLKRLRGDPNRIVTDHDPFSLTTQHWSWEDGLRVEIKDQSLGALAPYRACRSCDTRARCREGIHALRLTVAGRLVPCMDGRGLDLPLADIVAGDGPTAAAAAWRSWEGGL